MLNTDRYYEIQADEYYNSEAFEPSIPEPEKKYYWGCDECGIDYDPSKLDEIKCVECGGALTDSGIEIENDL